jgi:hypothetical protein
MLEDAIAISKKTLDEHDFETDGVEVTKRTNVLRLQRKSRSIWMRNGSPTGMFS